MTETNVLMGPLNEFRTALSALSEFKTWVGVATTALAAARIHTWDGEQDGEPLVVMAHGPGYSVDVVTLDQGTLVTPVIACEFSMSVDKSETNEAVFDELVTAVGVIMKALISVTGFVKSVSPDSEQTPARTKASAGVNYVYYRVNVSLCLWE